jgi:hypothetical protein
MAKATSNVDETKDTASVNLPVQKANGELVSVTVTKFGAGLVSTGERDMEGDIFASRGQKIMVSKDVGEKLETLGFAEID